MGSASSTEREVLPHFAGARLSHGFAHELPELSIPWQAAPEPGPEIVALNAALAAEIGIDPAQLGGVGGAEFLIGRALAAGSEPVAQLYAGHQFGSYSPVLGDGRALLLGEIRTPNGRTLDLHLKGSGRTPPARGDGFAVLGPMLREYLVSEAMHALGIPTTRSLAVVATGRTVRRDDFLRDDRLPGAVLTRVAASHLRVGTFQYARARGDRGLLERLVDFAIRRHYPHLEGSDAPALELFRAVVHAQAELTAQWMLVGFVHGVMNTDNVTISGETIDYGPCAFIDAYDPTAVFSSIDHAGRYAYGAQPAVAKWNLARFAEALLPLLGAAENEGAAENDGDGGQQRAVALAEAALAEFDEHFARSWRSGMAAKLGLGADAPTSESPVSESPVSEDAVPEETVRFAEELLAILVDGRIDYTGAFRALTDAAFAHRSRTRESARAETGAAAIDAARRMLAGVAGESGVRADAWLDRWLSKDPGPAVMARANPVTIPRSADEKTPAYIGVQGNSSARPGGVRRCPGYTVEVTALT
ncbi:MAG: YdiU family protein, partial [Actinobacteria bacterium]|nr:YdiU family protein [Actinomycetota bacterium]